METDMENDKDLGKTLKEENGAPENPEFKQFELGKEIDEEKLDEVNGGTVWDRGVKHPPINEPPGH